MADPALSYTGLFVLQAIAAGRRFGLDIMDATGLPSGTIYPALRRLEGLELVRSDWEPDKRAREERRPRRRYYELTPAGKRRLVQAEARYRAPEVHFSARRPRRHGPMCFGAAADQSRARRISSQALQVCHARPWQACPPPPRLRRGLAEARTSILRA